ncbi:MAG TPA: hypothetical protein VIJ18_15355 [Microbacteriaceae bacterium]
MALSFLILNAFILAITLESDLGRRKIGWFRVLRPLISALIAVPFFFSGMAWTGAGLALEIVALAVGVAMGYAACSLIRFEYDATTARTFTRAGIAYAAAWVTVSAIKTLASYGAQNWFTLDLGRWMMENDVSQDAIRAAFIFLSLGTPVTRAVVLFWKGTTTAHRSDAKLILFQRGHKQAPSGSGVPTEPDTARARTDSASRIS